ncbi:MAG: DUF4446 family protein [Actinomycetota bacterium]
MTLPNETLVILVLVSLGLNAIALIALLFGSMARRRREAQPVDPQALDPTVRGIFEDHLHSIKRLEGAARSLHKKDLDLEELLHASVRRVGLVRYDAFEDVGGRLSFSAAMLDDAGNGMVLTSINGRQDTRVYAKPVQAGESPYNLSVEEAEAIRQGVSGPREAVKA